MPIIALLLVAIVMLSQVGFLVLEMFLWTDEVSYRIFETTHPYFLTCSVVGWLPVFTRPACVEIVLDSWRFLQAHGRLTLFGYVVLVPAGRQSPRPLAVKEHIAHVIFRITHQLQRILVILLRLGTESCDDV